MDEFLECFGAWSLFKWGDVTYPIFNGNDDGGVEVRWGLFVDAIGADGLGKMSLKVVSEGVVASK